PAISIMLQSLDRDYLNIQQQYNTAVSRLAKAATGERIELLAKGQRITVLDPAAVPDKPTRPIRAWISIGGTVAGALLGFSLIALMEFLNTAIRRPVDIVSRLGITPIAVVPYIRTPMELVIRRAVFVSVFLLLVIGLPALIFAVHTYYLPLDLIYERIAGKIGDML
ncbi:MAG: GumC family protein, partial [Paracoccaceae bacterium]